MSQEVTKISKEARQEFWDKFGEFLKKEHENIFNRLSANPHDPANHKASFSLKMEKTAELSYEIIFKKHRQKRQPNWYRILG